MQKNLFHYLFLFFLLTSCTKSSKKIPKKILRLNFSRNPLSLDPRRGGEPISSALQFMLFDGLTMITSFSTSSLALAESVEISEDLLTYKFHLKESYWSNGRPITSYDFETSWKTMLSSEFPSPNAFLLFPIKNAKKAKLGQCKINEVGIHAQSSNLLIVELESPSPYFLELTSFCSLFPIYSENQKAFDYSFSSDLVNLPCSGAFKIKKWTQNYELILEKNPYYHLAQSVELDEIKISFVNDDMTAFHLFENKEIDILGGFFSDIPFEESQNLKERGLLKTIEFGSTIFCAFNLEKYPFNNLNIRKAFSLALNRKEIVKNILIYDEKPAYGIIPPFMKGEQSNSSMEEDDTALAQQYFNKGLEELNINSLNFPEVILSLESNNLKKRIGLAIQNQLENTLKIKVKLEPLDLKIYIDKLTSKSHSFALCNSVIQYNDIMNLLERFNFRSNSKNFSSFESKEFIELLEKTNLTKNNNERLNYFAKAEKILIKDAAIIGIYHPNLIYIKQDPIKNFFVSPIGSMHVNFIKIDESAVD